MAEVGVKESVKTKDRIEYKRKPVADPGLDESIKKLTPEKIEKAINAVLNLRKTAATFAAPLETCIHCALCSGACHWYLSHDKDPTYAPVAKVKMTLWEMIKRKGKVSPEFIKQCARIAFCECNLCRRCSMYCPFGLDIAFQMGMVRRICFLLGVVPQILMDYDNSLSATLTQLWITQADWIDTLQWQEEEVRMEIKNARIPVNKEGAEIMYVVLGTEPKLAPQFIATMAKIMNFAGIDWTFSTADYANMSMFARDAETMQRIVREVYEDAFRLKVKRIVATECGHAFHALGYAAPPLMGWKEGPIEILHAIEFYYELIRDGKIKIVRKIKGPVTVQDPCNLVRHRGAGEKLRYLIRETCEDFVDMYPNREHNFCCNAGGGVIAIGPPWKGVRLEGARVKAEQIKATGAKIICAPCHNCHVGIHDVVKFYNIDAEVKFMWDILLETMEIPEEFKVGK